MTGRHTQKLKESQNADRGLYKALQMDSRYAELDPLYGPRNGLEEFKANLKIYNNDSTDITSAATFQPPSHTAYHLNPLVAARFGLKVWNPEPVEGSYYLPVYGGKWKGRACYVDGV